MHICCAVRVPSTLTDVTKFKNRPQKNPFQECRTPVCEFLQGQTHTKVNARNHNICICMNHMINGQMTSQQWLLDKHCSNCIYSKHGFHALLQSFLIPLLLLPCRFSLSLFVSVRRTLRPSCCKLLTVFFLHSADWKCWYSVRKNLNMICFPWDHENIVMVYFYW